MPVASPEPFFLIAGPCVIESEEHTLVLGRAIRAAACAAGVPLVFKASFDKANRTSLHAYRGPGLGKGLEILGRVRQELGVPVLTDIHEPGQAERAAEVCDVLQIPAFLCRQTDLLLATAALQLLEARKITSLLAVDADGRLEGVVHLHDLWTTQMI